MYYLSSLKDRNAKHWCQTVQTLGSHKTTRLEAQHKTPLFKGNTDL